MIWFTKTAGFFRLTLEDDPEVSQTIEDLLLEDQAFAQLTEAEEYSGYQLDKLMEFFAES